MTVVWNDEYVKADHLHGLEDPVI